MAENILPGRDMITTAFAERAARLEVTEVSSVWSPLVEGDKVLARSTAEALIHTIEETHPKLDDATKEILLEFGAAVGALSLRRLFQPFQSDAIWVDYQDGSSQSQQDAVRRVTNGLGHETAVVVGRS